MSHLHIIKLTQYHAPAESKYISAWLQQVKWSIFVGNKVGKRPKEHASAEALSCSVFEITKCLFMIKAFKKSSAIEEKKYHDGSRKNKMCTGFQNGIHIRRKTRKCYSWCNFCQVKLTRWIHEKSCYSSLSHGSFVIPLLLFFNSKLTNAVTY